MKAKRKQKKARPQENFDSQELMQQQVHSPEKTPFFPSENINAIPSYVYLVLSFVFPVLIMGTVFALHRIFPFGDRQILVSDFWQQYYPFFNSFWHKVREGSLAPWSWTAGAGIDFFALFAYYMASPLNLLALLAPHALLREMLTLILLLKIGFAGLFTALYLRYAYRQYGPALPCFSALYALCAFTLGYYWNIMWFDSFALLPLVMLGVLALVREGKYRLYIISLALAVFTNYYIGFFICIFVAITFFSQCYLHKLDKQNFLRKLALIAAYSAIALGLAAVLLLPAYISLQGTHSSVVDSFPAEIRFTNNFIHIMGNFIALTPPTVREGLPNLYSGLISIMLASLFIRSKKVMFREKAVFIGTISFLLLSCNVNLLYFIWNGFHFTNMLPFRFSFLISFTIVVMAYRAYLLAIEIKRQDLVIMGFTAALFLLAAFIGPQENIFVLGSAGLCVIYLLVMDSLSEKKSGKLRTALSFAFFIVILAEVSISAFIGVQSNSTTARSTYPDRNKQVQELLGKRQTPDTDFFRTEFTNWLTLNDPSLYKYNGISFFSSTANVRTTRFMEGLGLPGWEAGNRFNYAETSPLTNAFLNVRYLICRDGKPADNGFFWQPVGQVDDSLLLRNSHYLPFGFMVNKELANFVLFPNNPFLTQNSLFRLATGLDESLFTIRDLGSQGRVIRDGDTIKTIWNYEMPSDGMIYAFCIIDQADNLTISFDGEDLRSIRIRRPYIFTVGNFSQSDIVTLRVDQEVNHGNAVVQIAFLNSEVFDKGHALLAAGALNLTEFSGTRIRGHVTALRDGLLYTSIPNDNNWIAYVNGSRSEIVLIGSSMIALRLTEGTHYIEFRYVNRSLQTGLTISLVSLAIFLALILLDRRRQKKEKSEQQA